MLSKIVREINERFGTDFMTEDKVRVVVEQLDADLAGDEALARSVEINPPAKARLSFEEFVKRKVQDLIDDHVKFYKKFADDPDFQDFFVESMFQRYIEAQRHPLE